MGLNATLNTTTYVDSSGNGIDVHMIKNSEWGAVAMLALSGYGGGSQNSSDSGYIGTYTTGTSNYTGVYGMGNGNWEYTATMTVDENGNINENSSYTSIFENGVDSRYYDAYYWTTGMTSTSYDLFYSYNYKSASSNAYFNHLGDAIYEMKDILLSYNSSANHYVTYAADPFFVRGYGGNGGVLASGSLGR